jgi:hypothetical protein
MNKKDPLKWLRDVRKKHYEETKDMTADEWIDWQRKGVKKFEEWQKKQKMEENKK